MYLAPTEAYCNYQVSLYLFLYFPIEEPVKERQKPHMHCYIKLISTTKINQELMNPGGKYLWVVKAKPDCNGSLGIAMR